MTATLSDLTALVDRQWHAHGRETPLNGLLLTRAETPSGIIRSVYRPSFCVVLQGAKTTMLGETPFCYAAGEGLLTSVDLPVTARITRASPEAPYLALSLAIDPESVADLLSAHPDALTEAPPFTPLSVTTLDSALFDPLARLLTLLDSLHDLAVLAPLIRKEIVWRLLHGPLGATLRHLGLADGHAARIRRATARIRDCYAEPLRVADLAALAHMSVPSFHRHFKAVTTMTPVQFHKQVRLQEARRRLIGAEDVAGVGYSIGYESPSQFSRDYRRLFGTSPGRDGAAMRAALTREVALP